MTWPEIAARIMDLFRVMNTANVVEVEDNDEEEDPHA